MKIIHPQNEFITTKKHLEKLSIYKECLENSINGVFFISKNLFKKKAIISNYQRNRVDELKIKLSEINESINFYTTRIQQTNGE